MTKFCGDAVGVRSGRPKGTLGKKDLAKNMEKFLETGVHPELERARQERENTEQPLPTHDPTRPFVFLDLSIANKPAGRLVIELYQDIAPAAALHLRARCLPGSSATLVGGTFTKLLRHYAAWGCRSPAAAIPGGGCVARFSRLAHVEAGCVSLSLDGAEVAVSLGRARNLDATHQVVGRVHAGRELLEQLCEVDTAPDDTPFRPIKVTAAGATNARGDAETLAAAAETPAETAERLQRESRDTRSAVMEALQEGMAGAKRKAPEAAGPSTQVPNSSSSAAAPAAGGGSGAAAAAGAAGGGGAGPSSSSSRLVRPRIRDPLLDELSEDEGSSSGEEEE